MEIPDFLSDGEARAIARAIFSASSDILYVTKKGFEDIAIQVDPDHTPSITVEGREDYLRDVLRSLPFNSAVRFVGEIVATFHEIIKIEGGSSSYLLEAHEGTYKRIDAVVSRVNKVLHQYGVALGSDGTASSTQALKELTAVQAEVYDGLGRWHLEDVRKLLENAESHYREGKSNILRYDDCASNAAKALEGVLRKALVEAHIAKGYPDPTPKLKTMMADAIKELDGLNFWPNPAIREAVDNYRKFLRNKSQHYNTETLDIKLVGFDRVTAFFALWEALTLIGTIIEAMDELQ